MSSAWLLPEHIADVLPAQARHIEDLRSALLHVTRGYGFELVMPPLLEHLDSLLSGHDRELDLKTFKLVDQLSGRALGVRADTTAQVARIDAHLLNRQGVTRLCYVGPVLHARPSTLNATREPLQFGAEAYGHAGLEADLEIQDLALDCLRAAGVGGVTIDAGDARIVRGLLAGAGANAARVSALVMALAAKDDAALQSAAAGLPDDTVEALRSLLRLYGGADVLEAARRRLPDRPLVRAALDDLHWLAEHVRQAHPEVKVGFDLADLGDYNYYTGVRFAVYVPGSSDAILRGGRYDEVGAVFGRNRPAVGFSLDLKEIAGLVPAAKLRPAIRAPWAEDAQLRTTVRLLRDAGETVVFILPGHEHEAQEYECDRELVAIENEWTVRPL